MKASPSPAEGAEGSIPLTLYLHAFVVLVTVRIGLTFIGYQKLERLFPAPRKDARSKNPWQVSWAVKRMAGFVPWGSCLTQAFSLQYLLGIQGEASIICVGVRPEDAGRFSAHAWLLWDDQIIIGGRKNLNEYMVIARLEAPAQ